MNMKIYLVGAHSTGKTTIANHIARRYGFNKINETARQVLREWGTTLEEVRSDLERVKKFQKEVLKKQVEAERKTKEPYISDRGIDILAYCAMYTDIQSDILESDLLEEHIKRHHKKDTTVVFVRPIEDLIKEDEVRTELSTKNIYQIDGMIKYILESYDIDYVSLESKHLNERIRTMETLISHQLS